MNNDAYSFDVSATDHSGDKQERCDFCSAELPFSTTPWRACTDSSGIFAKSLRFGRIRGIAGIIGCKSSGTRDFIRLARELIKRDILVTVSGCIVADMEKNGLMASEVFQCAGEGLAELCEYLGISPIFYMGGLNDNAAMADFYTLLATTERSVIGDLPIAAITLQPHKKQSLISDLHGDSVFYMQENPEKTADGIDMHIHLKRLKLEWCDRLHCSEETYS